MVPAIVPDSSCTPATVSLNPANVERSAVHHEGARVGKQIARPQRERAAPVFVTVPLVVVIVPLITPLPAAGESEVCAAPVTALAAFSVNVFASDWIVRPRRST